LIESDLRPAIEGSVRGRFKSTASELAARTVAYQGDRQPSIFAHLTSYQTNRVVARGRRQKLLPGEGLFAQDERHDGVFLIESGLIRTFYASPSGREITLAYWKPGNIVGTPQVLGSGINMWSGVAVIESEVLAFRGKDLRELMRRIPELAVALIEALEFKGKCLSAMVQMLGTRSVSERLSMLLVNLSELHGVGEKDGIAIGAPFTHEVLAQMVGATRQWVTMTLDRFQREGLIRVGKRKTVILEPERLRMPVKG
jgi:CRP-like cAMP-binding protein